MKEQDIVDRIADNLLQDHVELMNENRACRQAAEQALEALGCISSPRHISEINKIGAAIAALRAALAEPTLQESLQVPADMRRS